MRWRQKSEDDVCVCVCVAWMSAARCTSWPAARVGETGRNECKKKMQHFQDRSAAVEKTNFL
jgi:hypothetical protein